MLLKQSHCFFFSVILSIQGRRKYGKLPPTIIRYIFFVRVTEIFCVSIPLQLRALWEELNVKILIHQNYTKNARYFQDEPYSQYIEWKNKTSQTKSGIQVYFFSDYLH
jgi:hypothetical protein